MNTFDIIALFHLLVQSIWAIVYVLWQFGHYHCTGRHMQTIIDRLNVFETIVLVLSLFVERGPWGTFALAAWYVINSILLVMQFLLADWGALQKIKDILWIAFYVYLYMSDVHHVDMIHELIAKYGPQFVQFGEAIKGTYWGDVLKAVIIALVKLVFNYVVRRHSYDSSNCA